MISAHVSYEKKPEVRDYPYLTRTKEGSIWLVEKERCVALYLTGDGTLFCNHGRHTFMYKTVAELPLFEGTLTFSNK